MDLRGNPRTGYLNIDQARQPEERTVACSHTGDSDNMAAASGDGGAAVLSADAAMALRNFESENNIREGVPDEM